VGGQTGRSSHAAIIRIVKVATRLSSSAGKGFVTKVLTAIVLLQEILGFPSQLQRRHEHLHEQTKKKSERNTTLTT